MTEFDHPEIEKLRGALSLLVDQTPLGTDFDQLGAPVVATSKPTGEPDDSRTARKPLAVAMAVLTLLALIWVTAGVPSPEGDAGPSRLAAPEPADDRASTPSRSTTGQDAEWSARRIRREPLDISSVELTADESASELFAEASGELRVVVRDWGSTPTPARVTDSIELEALEYFGDPAGLSLVATDGLHAVYADSSSRSVPDLHAGPLGARPTVHAGEVSSFRFHPTSPGLIAWIETGESHNTLRMANLESGVVSTLVALPASSAESASPISERQSVGSRARLHITGWSEAGIVVLLEEPGSHATSFVVAPPFELTEVAGRVLALSDDGIALVDDGDPLTPYGLVHVGDTGAPRPLDLGDLRLEWGRWDPEREVFVLTARRPGAADEGQVVLMAQDGETVGELRVDVPLAPWVRSWDRYLVAHRIDEIGGGRGGGMHRPQTLLIWDPETDVVGTVSANVEIFAAP